MQENNDAINWIEDPLLDEEQESTEEVQENPTYRYPALRRAMFWQGMD